MSLTDSDLKFASTSIMIYGLCDIHTPTIAMLPMNSTDCLPQMTVSELNDEILYMDLLVLLPYQ